MNRDLIVLINARLVGSEPVYHQQIKAREARNRATWIGAQILAQGEKPSIREIAKILAVSPSTVSRWFKPGEFDAECVKLSAFFNSDRSFNNPFGSASITKTDPSEQLLQSREFAQHTSASAEMTACQLNVLSWSNLSSI